MRYSVIRLRKDLSVLVYFIEPFGYKVWYHTPTILFFIILIKSSERPKLSLKL